MSLANMRRKTSDSLSWGEFQTHPEQLLDHLLAVFRLATDSQLSMILELDPATISRVRHGKASLSPTTMLRIHELTGIGIKTLRYMTGDTRPHTGRSASKPTHTKI